jgi:predicted nucleotidyltransferase
MDTGNKNIIYEVICGSMAYGTSTPTSDRDIRGIWLPTIEEHLGLEDPVDIRDDEEDTVYMTIKRFFKLASQCNPNILELFYISEPCILRMDYRGKIIRNNRALFLGADKIYERFRGYAQEEFLAISTVNKKTGAKRKELIEKHGWSSKNALNMVRLMEEGIEYLRDGEVILPRKNADYLLKIKNYEVEYEDLVKRYNELNRELDDAYKNTKLQKEVDLAVINKLLVQLIKG